MAQSTTNAASSYLHDHSPAYSPDISLSRRLHHSGGGRDIDGHLPPTSRKYRVKSAARAELEHDDFRIETSNDYPSSSRLMFPSKVVPSTVASSLAASSATYGTSTVLTHEGAMTSSSQNVKVFNPDVSKFNQDTQHSVEGEGGGSIEKSPARVQNSDKSSENVSQWKRLHRIVEQMDDEPCCIILFKWLLIIVGIGMLVAVIEIMGEVLYAWFSGNLEANLPKTSAVRDNSTYLINQTEFGSGNHQLDELTTMKFQGDE